MIVVYFQNRNGEAGSVILDTIGEAHNHARDIKDQWWFVSVDNDSQRTFESYDGEVWKDTMPRTPEKYRHLYHGNTITTTDGYTYTILGWFENGDFWNGDTEKDDEQSPVWYKAVTDDGVEYSTQEIPTRLPLFTWTLLTVEEMQQMIAAKDAE